MKGALSNNGLRSQAGTIHSDANGSGCGNSVFYGKATDGIIAYAAPKVGAPTTPDPLKPGQITSVAGTLGITSVDSANNVYGTSSLSGSGGQTAAGGRPLVSRSIVDYRYLAGVKSAMNGAQSSVFSSLNAGNAVANGYTEATCSSGNVASIPPLTSADKLFVDCSNTKSMPAINAGTVVFSGAVSPSGDLSLPNATHVYIFGATPALDIGNNTDVPDEHQERSTLPPATARTPRRSNRAVLFIKNGDIKQTAGTLRLCNTTVYMMGGQNDGCVPSYTPATCGRHGPAPTQSPCTSGTGNGQIVTTGGNIDWTAPNQYDQIDRRQRHP